MVINWQVIRNGLSRVGKVAKPLGVAGGLTVVSAATISFFDKLLDRHFAKKDRRELILSKIEYADELAKTQNKVAALDEVNLRLLEEMNKRISELEHKLAETKGP